MVEMGLEAALECRPAERVYERKPDGCLIALAYSQLPAVGPGRACGCWRTRW